MIYASNRCDVIPASADQSLDISQYDLPVLADNLIATVAPQHNRASFRRCISTTWTASAIGVTIENQPGIVTKNDKTGRPDGAAAVAVLGFFLRTLLNGLGHLGHRHQGPCDLV